MTSRIVAIAARARGRRMRSVTTACEPAAALAPRRRPHRSAPALGVYVTNETGGDLSVIDAATNMVVATIPLGKRPRGIVASPDRTRFCYVALSGSPIGGPNVDEIASCRRPTAAPTASASSDVRQRKLVKVLPPGPIPSRWRSARTASRCTSRTKTRRS